MPAWEQWRMDTADGLVTAWLFDAQGGGRELDWDSLPGANDVQGTLWAHLDYTHPHSQQWLREQSGIDPIAVDALLAEETRPRCTLINGTLLLILRGVNLNPGSDPEDMVSIRIWSDGKRIITTRKRRLLSIEDLRQSLANGSGPCTPAGFITQLADQLSTRMSDVISGLDDAIDDLEQRVLTLQSHQLRPMLSSLRRETIALRRYLSPQRDALTRLVSERLGWFGEEERSQLREVTDRTVRYIEELDAIRERAVVVQEELISRLSEQVDKRMYVLSIVAALFLPLGFLTGLFGINVGGLPGTDNEYAFGIFSGILIVLLGLQLILFRWKRWF
jgi:zinc transporter